MSGDRSDEVPVGASRGLSSQCTDERNGVTEEYPTRPWGSSNAALLRVPRRIVYATRIPPRPKRRAAFSNVRMLFVVKADDNCNVCISMVLKADDNCNVRISFILKPDENCNMRISLTKLCF